MAEHFLLQMAKRQVLEARDFFVMWLIVGVSTHVAYSCYISSAWLGTPKQKGKKMWLHTLPYWGLQIGEER